MSEGSSEKITRRSWLTHAQQAATALKSSTQYFLEAANGDEEISGDGIAYRSESWARECSEIRAWLEATPAPDALRDAESEMQAYLGVSRTATALLRSLADVSGEQRLSRITSLQALLTQAEDHLHRFQKLLKDKHG